MAIFRGHETITNPWSLTQQKCTFSTSDRFTSAFFFRGKITRLRHTSRLYIWRQNFTLFFIESEFCFWCGARKFCAWYRLPPRRLASNKKKLKEKTGNDKDCYA